LSRFTKGQSGNPKGRPRKAPAPRASAFDIIIDKTLTVAQGGRTRELSVEEVLQLNTYREALAGNRAAGREVLKMIAKREKWLAEKRPARTSVTMSTEGDPDNANEALLILGIVDRDPREYAPGDPYDRYLLEPWAVEAALRRSARRPISAKQVAEIRRCTRDPDTLRWPPGIKP
jgi:hypothetical protein